MKHACLGWGSLLWDTQGLPLKGVWNPDGPKLPIEFARQSQDDRITLVLVPGKRNFSSYWALLNVKDSSEAKEVLCDREKISRKNIEAHIGIWCKGLSVRNAIEKSVAGWAASKSLTSVVWTALPPAFNGKKNVIPTKEEVVSHLSKLRTGAKERAKKYVIEAPVHLNTEYRIYIESKLGWSKTQ